MCSSQCYLYSGPSFHWGTNHSPAHSGWRTKCWGNQPSAALVPKEWRQHLGCGMNSPINSTGQFSVTNSFQHNSFPGGMPHQLPGDIASCSLKGEFYGPVWMANGTRYPVLWQGKAVAAGSSPECTDGNVVWQRRTHGCAEVTAGNGCALAVKREPHQLNTLCIRACNCSCGWAGEEDTKVDAEGDECSTVLVTQDTRFTGLTQTTTMPLKFLHQQFLSPSAELLVPYIYSFPSDSLSLSNPQISLQATGRRRKSKYAARCSSDWEHGYKAPAQQFFCLC